MNAGFERLPPRGKIGQSGIPSQTSLDSLEEFMMWSSANIDQSQEYRIALCQAPDGARTHVLQIATVAQTPEHAVFMTTVVPTELLLRSNLRAISKAVTLTNGQRYWVDPHGVWLTLEELDALESDDESEVPWVNGLPALFAPK